MMEKNNFIIVRKKERELCMKTSMMKKRAFQERG